MVRHDGGDRLSKVQLLVPPVELVNDIQAVAAPDCNSCLIGHRIEGRIPADSGLHLCEPIAGGGTVMLDFGLVIGRDGEEICRDRGSDSLPLDRAVVGTQSRFSYFFLEFGCNHRSNALRRLLCLALARFRSSSSRTQTSVFSALSNDPIFFPHLRCRRFPSQT
ncbi:hypothetical protein ACLOJK_020174 [Asimina triloba]